MGTQIRPDVLTKQQICDYERDGFLILSRIIDDGEVIKLRHAYDEIISKNVVAKGDTELGEITRQILQPEGAHEVFRNNKALDAARDIASQVFDDHATVASSMLIYKPPKHPHATPWHQDMAYSQFPLAPAGEPITLDRLQFWVALDDVDEETGCMHFLPGYHRKPLLAHEVASGSPGDSNRLLALENPSKQVDLSKAVSAPLKCGGATVHNDGTPHFTPPNRSTNRHRRAYILNVTTVTVIRKKLCEMQKEELIDFLHTLSDTDREVFNEFEPS